MEEKKKRKIIIRKKPRDPKKKLDRKKLLRILGIVLFLGVSGVLGAIYGAYRAVTRNLPLIMISTLPAGSSRLCRRRAGGQSLPGKSGGGPHDVPNPEKRHHRRRRSAI
jgi:hypothetical protein